MTDPQPGDDADADPADEADDSEEER